ncbi:hypothetical protein [Acidithiobacillus sp.]
MAKYQLISEEETHKIYIVRSSGFLESLKLAWYVIRYPGRTPVLMVVDKKWCEDNLEISRDTSISDSQSWRSE